MRINQKKVCCVMKIGKVASENKEKLKKRRSPNAKNRSKRDLTEEELIKLDLKNTDDDTLKSTYKRRVFMHRFKLGAHHKMERFSILMAICTFGLLFFMFIGFQNNRQAVADQVGTIAQYDNDISFSISQASGTVEGVYRNPEGTRGMVLLKMTDVGSIPTRADQYQLFLSVLEDKFDNEPAGNMIVFGASGYMAVELYDERGLENKVLEFTLRSLSDLTESDMSTEQIEAMDDPSFGYFDQTKFYANLGASEAIVIPALSEELTAVELYYALVGIHEEEAIYTTIQSQTDELAVLKARHEEFATRLTELGYEAPEMPVFMQGDEFVAHEEVVQEADPEAGIEEKVEERLEFKPSTNVYGAHEFEYYGKTVTDGYVSQVVDDVKDFRDYLSTKRAEKQSISREEKEASGYNEDVPKIDTLIRTMDGSELKTADVSPDNSTSQEIAAVDAAQQLNTAWREYLSVKQSLQTDTLSSLLLLDADVRTQGNGFSEHSGEDFMTIWYR